MKVRMMQVEIKERDARVDGIRLSLLANSPQNISLLFPEIFPPEAQTNKEVDEALSSEGPTTFESVSPKEAAEMLSVLGNSGMLTTEDLLNLGV